MKLSGEAKQQLIKQLSRSFDKESHASALVSGILRSCKDEIELSGIMERATKVVESVRARGVSSFFAAEYGKLFSDPQTAMATRERLMAVFEMNHSLPPKRAAKLADCIVFCAAKKQDEQAIGRLSRLCSDALTAGFPFNIIADGVYYNAPDISKESFFQKVAQACVEKNVSMTK